MPTAKEESFKDLEDVRRRLIWVFPGRTSLIVAFVVRWFNLV